MRVGLPTDLNPALEPTHTLNILNLCLCQLVILNTCLTGGKFSGTFLSDQRNGPGIYTWPDGDRYEGNWNQGARFGFGRLITKSGEVLEQFW